MNEPGRSYHQPHQQAWQQYQQQQQQQQSRQQPLRQSSRETPKKVKSYNEDSYYSASTEGMVLDPLTGDFVPAGGGGCGEDDDDDGDVQVLNNEKPVVIKLGQLASKHSSENSTQGSHRVPKLTINLGRPIDGSNGGVSSSKKHHKKHKHKKKKKRHIDSDEDDDDVVELSNDSDADYRVWETKNPNQCHKNTGLFLWQEQESEFISYYFFPPPPSKNKKLKNFWWWYFFNLKHSSRKTKLMSCVCDIIPAQSQPIFIQN